eukprot:7850132-Alexandrium_andersonii.AAC.1
MVDPSVEVPLDLAAPLPARAEGGKSIVGLAGPAKLTRCVLHNARSHALHLLDGRPACDVLRRVPVEFGVGRVNAQAS